MGPSTSDCRTVASKRPTTEPGKKKEEKKRELFFPVNGKDKRCIRGWPQNYFKVFLSAPGRRRYTGIKRMKKGKKKKKELGKERIK